MSQSEFSVLSSPPLSQEDQDANPINQGQHFIDEVGNYALDQDANLINEVMPLIDGVGILIILGCRR